MKRHGRLLVYSLFIASGTTALVYEVTWLRNLSLVFGTSFQATSIVLASFMAGLGLGGFAGGFLAKRATRPLRVYGWLEFGIAGWALILPALLRGVDAFYVAAALRTDRLAFALPLVRVVMAFGVLVVPTFLMGATLPLLTKAVVRHHTQFGARLSWLYGSNTLGAVIGTLSAGFLLIPALGVWRSQLCALAVNLLIGSIAVSVDRRYPGVEGDERRTKVSRQPVPAGVVRFAERPVLQLAFWGTAVSGFCALSLEVLWTRAISIAVGGTVYSFTVMLAAFLTGIWLGSWLHALFPLRRIHEAAQFALTLVLAGIFSLAASFWIPRLPELAIRLNQGLYADLTRIRPGTAMLLAFLVMLVPCLFIGVAFPLANQARARLSEGYGRPVGDTLGLNTLGSIGGSLAAGFVLIPAFGLQRSMLFSSALYLAYGALVLGALGLSWLPRARWAAVVATTVFVACALSLPLVARPWSVSALGGFVNNNLPAYVDSEGRVDFQTRLETGTVQFYREGRVATVSVWESNGYRSLIVNGKIVASDSPADMYNLLMLGHVPVLMHPDPKSALVIGLGAGVTLGAVAAHESLEEIVLAEIEPAMLDAARLFGAANGSALEEPRLHVHLEDGRNFLKTTTKRFDVITADPIHPWTRGSGYLFTSEYYRLAADRLAEGGIMCQWVPVGEFTPADFKSIVATFAGVFPHTMLWHSHAAVLIGSRVPIRVDIDNLACRIGQPRVARQLGSLGLDDPFSFLADLTMVDAQVHAFAKGAVVNNDDNLHLEFSSPLANLSEPHFREITLELDAFRNGTIPLVDDDPRLETLQRYQRAKSVTFRARLALQSAPAEQNQWAEQQLRALLRELPGYAPARHELALHLARRGARQLGSGLLQRAFESSREAVSLMPDDPGVRRTLGVTLARQGRLDEAIFELERARELQPRHWLNYYLLSETLMEAGRAVDAIEVLRTGLTIIPSNPHMRERLDRWLELQDRG